MLTDFLRIHGFAFVLESHTERYYFQARQLRQAVVDTFGDAIGNVVGIGNLAAIFKWQNGDGIDTARFGALQIYADCGDSDRQQNGGHCFGEGAALDFRAGRCTLSLKGLTELRCGVKALAGRFCQALAHNRSERRRRAERIRILVNDGADGRRRRA